MITANELRIGNVLFTESVYEDTVTGISDKVIFFDGHSELVEDCDGIPLTEDWLLEFGFVESLLDNGKEYNKEDFIIRHIESSFKWYYCNITAKVEIKYVHNLQNIYRSFINDDLIPL